jgi:threonine/homoserine/homoserine lactone efflux protein
VDAELVLISIVIGIAIEAPLGAVNLIIIRATLRSGLPGGLFAAIGSVMGETAFAIAVAFGLQGIGSLILRYGLLLQIVGGVILLAMGIRAFRSHVAEGAIRLDPVPRTSLARKASPPSFSRSPIPRPSWVWSRSSAGSVACCI